MAKRKKGEQQHGTYVYCGQEGLVTDDHVFPKTIFLVLDEQMVTVPACDACQGIKSLGDRDLRNYIVMDIGGSRHPDAIAHAKRMLGESNVRLRTWLRKQLAEAGCAHELSEEVRSSRSRPVDRDEAAGPRLGGYPRGQ